MVLILINQFIKIKKAFNYHLNIFFNSILKNYIIYFKCLLTNFNLQLFLYFINY